MIVSSEAVVLSARKHGETSKIVWAYSREYGKISVIAKGAREIKSKFGGALEMFAASSFTFYKKEKSEGLYLLSKADLISTNRGILTDLDSIEAATEIVELLIRTMHDEEKNDNVFELLTASLSAMSSAPAAASAILIRFYIEFARISGFEVRSEFPEGPRTDATYRFHYPTGELHQYTDAEEYIPATFSLTNASARTLVHLVNSSIDQARSLRMTDAVRTELRALFQTYFTHHFAGFASRSMRSSHVFTALNRRP